jgi:phosphoribosylformimino-5-aminoimidazole carboxamide ribotide isomerase
MIDLLPAIDLLDGKVVRLAQGRRDQVTVYSDDPVAVAQRWVNAGARWLHVVDLNGAFDGTYTNLPLARQIIEACSVHVEFSGGIRTEETLAEAIVAGAARVVLGTKACEDPAFLKRVAQRFHGKIAVAIDAKGGQVMSRGWVGGTAFTPAALAQRVAGDGVETLIATDVSRDGMLQGPNLELVREVLRAGAPRVIVSGGIASLEDLAKVKALEPEGVIGAIVGKALYEGTIDAQAAIAALRA